MGLQKSIIRFFKPVIFACEDAFCVWLSCWPLAKYTAILNLHGIKPMAKANS
jgi:hypothetical protein